MLPKFDRNAKPVTSSNIVAHSYNADDMTLDVEFQGGRRYRYRDVGMDKADNFAKADSKGSFLHKYIIPHHPAKKI